MKEQATQALNDIHQKLVTLNEDFLTDQRIDYKSDIEQNYNASIILSETVTKKLFEFGNTIKTNDYKEYGTFFYGRVINNYLYISGYTGNDFISADGIYENGSVEPSKDNYNELLFLTNRNPIISNPYNVVVHLHTHPDHIIDQDGNILKVLSNSYSDQDLFFYACQQLNFQPKNNPTVFLGGLMANDLDDTQLSFVMYDPTVKNFVNFKNIYYIYEGNVYKINNQKLNDSNIVNREDYISIKKKVLDFKRNHSLYK